MEAKEAASKLEIMFAENERGGSRKRAHFDQEQEPYYPQVMYKKEP